MKKRNAHEQELRNRCGLYGLRINNHKREIKTALHNITEYMKEITDLPEGDAGFLALYDKARKFPSIAFLNAVEEINKVGELVKDLLTVQGIIETTDNNIRLEALRPPEAKKPQPAKP